MEKQEKKKQNSRRAIGFECYRNIGFSDERTPKSESLVISNSVKKEEIGDLVIIIGPNNSGKSNVLSGIKQCVEKQLSNRDITNLYYEKELKEPKLTFYTRDVSDNYGVSGECKYSRGSIFKKVFEHKNTTADVVKELSGHIKEIMNGFDKSLVSDDIVLIKENTGSIFTGEPKFDFDAFANMDKQEQREYLYRFYKSHLEDISSTEEDLSDFPILSYLIDNGLLFDDTDHEENKMQYEDNFKSKYGYDFYPKTFVYKENMISNSDIVIDLNNLSQRTNTSSSYYGGSISRGSVINSPSYIFFKNLFSGLGISIEDIQEVYKQFVEQQNKGILKNHERIINKKLSKIEKDFNKLYFLEKEDYRFELSLESDRIYFNIYKGDNPLTLEYQSTGFRWFFNLYFNLLINFNLEPGSILIMDEPATNLHVRGQEELRGFLKEFAVKNNISIVIATHSEHLIDLDYLDELRIVSSKDGVSHISNLFSAFEIDEPDSLKVVKDSLTCNRYNIVDPDSIVVFVEGITDYNYLVTMKKKLGYENIYFLPFNGVGKTEKEMEEISKKLISIRKSNPIVLVDSDENGIKFKVFNEKKKSELKVIPLNDIDSKFGEIESLFSKEDAKKYGIVSNEGEIDKTYSHSIILKNKILFKNETVSKETESNFKKVFDFLMDK